MRKNFKKHIAMSLCAAVLSSTVLATPSLTAQAATNSKEVVASAFSLSDSASFSVTADSQSWGNNSNATMYLNNLLDNQVSNWKLTLKNVNFTIDSIWCAEAVKSGTNYVITPFSWNSLINSDGSVSFGFNATGTLPSTFDFTVDYTMNGVTYTYDSANAGTQTTTTPTTTSPSIAPSPSPSTETTMSPSPSPSAETSTAPSPSPSAEASLIDAPLNLFDRTMPSVGKVKAITFQIEFQDVKFSNGLTAEELEEALYGEENTSAASYPMESARAFYKRASYGNLDLTGDVFSYTAKYNRSYYNNKNEYETLAMEVMKALDSQIDYSDYDGDGDGYLDCMTLFVPKNGTSEDDFWYGCQATWYLNNNFSLDGTKVHGYVMNDEQATPGDTFWHNCTYCHELGHLMGLPDYYKYNSSDWEGLHGSAGYERMDDSCGDFSSFSKLMYGWLKTDEVKVFDTSKNTQTFKLKSASDCGNCIILPIGDLDDNYFSEYFIIEYVTDSNNYDGWVGNGGIRVMHVNAETFQSPYNPYTLEFKYANFSSYYDTSDNKERVLYLVNDNNGFYQSGATITYGTTNFAAYDSSGNQTINTGYSITVGSLNNGEYTITVTK